LHRGFNEPSTQSSHPSQQVIGERRFTLFALRFWTFHWKWTRMKARFFSSLWSNPPSPCNSYTLLNITVIQQFGEKHLALKWCGHEVLKLTCVTSLAFPPVGQAATQHLVKVAVRQGHYFAWHRGPRGKFCVVIAKWLIHQKRSKIARLSLGSRLTRPPVTRLGSLSLADRSHEQENMRARHGKEPEEAVRDPGSSRMALADISEYHGVQVVDGDEIVLDMDESSD